MGLLKNLCLLLCGLLPLSGAWALDAMTLDEPTPITDQKISVGSRTLTLPEGDWVYMGKFMNEFTIDGRPNSKIANVYLVNIKDNRLEASIFLSLPVQSLNTDRPVSLAGSRCDETDDYEHKEVFSSNRSAPACHMVYAMDNHLKSDSPLFKGARLWLELQKIKITAPFSVSFYTKLSDNEFGEIYVFHPMAKNHSLDTLARWGRQLHDSLESFFVRRTRNATLPPLP